MCRFTIKIEVLMIWYGDLKVKEFSLANVADVNYAK